jgi:hypothetical protein
MQNSLTNVSLLFGLSSWVLFVLRLSDFWGTGFGSIVLFFLPAMGGLIIGIIAHIKHREKMFTAVAIGISAVPFLVLALMIVLRTQSNDGTQYLN